VSRRSGVAYNEHTPISEPVSERRKSGASEAAVIDSISLLKPLKNG